MSEAKKKAAFAQQTALAKSIGSKGAILSAGRTGQSVGLLINDAERQSGFAQAQAWRTLGLYSGAITDLHGSSLPAEPWR